MKTIKVDKSACIGCGACVQIDSDVFTFDDDGLSKVKVDTVEEVSDKTIMAVEGCPTGAISIEGECKCHCDCGEDCECGDECKCHDGEECTCGDECECHCDCCDCE